jgi:ribosomal protein S18 acetylase RimI-like enzyme
MKNIKIPKCIDLIKTKKDNVYYYYLYTDKKIGSIHFTKNDLTFYVCYLHVDKSLRRRKLGTYLLNTMLNEAKKMNIIDIHLDDMTDLKGEKNIYIKMGFKYNNYPHPEMIGHVNKLKYYK